MTEKEVTETISRVADRYAYKFQFGFYTPDDIRQEAFIIAMEALDRYDESRPLENFLAVHVKNRLNNFKRDKYYRQQKEDQAKKNEIHNNAKKFLMDPIDISSVRDEHEDNMRLDDDFVTNVEDKELFDLVDANLDVGFRGDYLRILHGVYVPKPRREQIFDEINRILKENKYEEG
tara:strand:- start:428 stop:955 length:528 start_codon:yes stop_codon:yes gene_type:complete